VGGGQSQSRWKSKKNKFVIGQGKLSLQKKKFGDASTRRKSIPEKEGRKKKKAVLTGARDLKKQQPNRKGGKEKEEMQTGGEADDFIQVSIYEGGTRRRDLTSNTGVRKKKRKRNKRWTDQSRKPEWQKKKKKPVESSKQRNSPLGGKGKKPFCLVWKRGTVVVEVKKKKTEANGGQGGEGSKNRKGGGNKN